MPADCLYDAGQEAFLPQLLCVVRLLVLVRGADDLFVFVRYSYDMQRC